MPVYLESIENIVIFMYNCKLISSRYIKITVIVIILLFFSGTLRGDLQVAFQVACILSSISDDVNLFGNDHQHVEAIDQWTRFAFNDLSNPNKFVSSMHELNSSLRLRKFLVGDMLSYGDIAVWAELKSMFHFIVFEFDIV